MAEPEPEPEPEPESEPEPLLHDCRICGDEAPRAELCVPCGCKGIWIGPGFSLRCAVNDTSRTVLENALNPVHCCDC